MGKDFALAVVCKLEKGPQWQTSNFRGQEGMKKHRFLPKQHYRLLAYLSLCVSKLGAKSIGAELLVLFGIYTHTSSGL